MSNESRTELSDDLLGHERWLRALVRTLVFDGDTADDVVQDTWLEVLKGKRRDLASPRGWLTVVARRLIGEHARRDRMRKSREPEAAKPERIDHDSAAHRRLEWHQELVGAVQSLDHDQKTVVVMRFFDGLEPSEIAQRLGLEPTTVRNRLHRAMKELREKLDRKSGDRTTWSIALLALARPSGIDVLRAAIFCPSQAIVAAMLVLMFASSIAFIRRATDSGGPGLDRTTTSGRTEHLPLTDGVRRSPAGPAPIRADSTADRPIERSPSVPEAVVKRTIRGVVQTPSASPIPECDIEISETVGPWFTSFDWFERLDRRAPKVLASTKSDGAGRFTIDAPIGAPYRLTVRRIGFGASVVASSEIPGDGEIAVRLIRTTVAACILLDDRDAPIPDARIEVRVGDLVAQAFSAPIALEYRSRNDGTFEIDLLTREPIGAAQPPRDRGGSLVENAPPRIYAEKPGHVRACGVPFLDRPLDAGGRAIVRLPRSRRVNIRLECSGERPQLKNGARLLLREATIPWQGIARFDADGCARIDDCPQSAQFDAVLDADGWVFPRPTTAQKIGAQNSIVPVRLQDGDDVTTILEVVRGGAVSGRVVASADGSPVPNVAIVAFPDTGSVAGPSHVRRAITDADGRYRIEGLENTFVEVRIETPDFFAILDEKAYDEAVFLADLSPGQKIRGKTIVRRDEPLAYIVFSGPGDDVIGVDFRTRPASSVAGKIVDESGRGVAGATIAFDRSPDDKKSWPRSLDEQRRIATTTSDADGRFFLPAIPADPASRLIVRKEGFPPQVVPNIGRRRSDDADVVVRMIAGAPITLTLIDDGGTPIAGLGVALSPEESRDIGPNPDDVAGVTAADGKVVFGTVLAGTLRIEIDHAFDRGFDASVVHQIRLEYRGDQPLSRTIELPRLASVSGRVTTKSGQPRSFVTIVARPLDADSKDARTYRTRSDAEGRFTIEIPANSPVVVQRIEVPPEPDKTSRRILAPVEKTVLTVAAAAPDIVVDD